MGFIASINFRNTNPNVEVVFIGAQLHTAKILETNLKKNSKISVDSDFFLVLDDRANESLLDESQAGKFFQWKFNGHLFNLRAKDFENLQYLSFLINGEISYMCFHPGRVDNCCFIDFFPSRDWSPEVDNDPNFIETKFSKTYWEQNILICFK